VKTWFDEGLHAIIDGTHVLFDPSNYFERHPSPPECGKIDIILVSHAHADHVNLLEQHGNIKKIMHPASFELATQYKKIGNSILLQRDIHAMTTVPRYKSIKFRNLLIESFNAGHCIGSVQFKITSPEGRFVFTGDINTEGSVAMPPAEILEADVLAIEATMGTPEMIAMPRADAYPYIHEFLKKHFSDGNKVIAFYGHAIGKGQELTKIVNYFEDIDDINVLVDNRIAASNGIYDKYEIPVGKYGTMGSALPRGKVVLLMDAYKLHENEVTAGKKFGLDKEPPSLLFSAIPHDELPFDRIVLSSHADFNALNAYVDASMQNKKFRGNVVVFHGFHATFTRHLDGREYNAVDAHEDVYKSI
jgi:putative mRNA 3-end processing factor